VSSWTGRLASAALLAAAAAVATPLVLLAAATPAAASVPSAESRLLSLTNADRAHAGLPPLRSSATLVTVARAWSTTMAATGQMVHDPSLASKVTGWTMIGENIAVASSADQAERLFLSSPPHRANILQRRFDRVGIGITQAADGRLWITVDFMQTTGYVPPAAGPPNASHTGGVTSRSRSTHHTSLPRTAAHPAGAPRPAAGPTTATRPVATSGSTARWRRVGAGLGWVPQTTTSFGPTGGAAADPTAMPGFLVGAACAGAGAAVLTLLLAGRVRVGAAVAAPAAFRG
jgi:Cysteine-rich secretory protein family